MFLVQIQPNHPLDEMSMACILRDLLHAVEYLHNEGKIHRDIKGLHSHLSCFLNIKSMLGRLVNGTRSRVRGSGES